VVSATRNEDLDGRPQAAVDLAPSRAESLAAEGVTADNQRFRRLNGVWVGGLASRVVFGGDAAASTAHFLAMGAAIWAAFEERWWLVGLCAIAGGAGYALCGVRWMRSYRSDPAAHSRGESVLLLVILVVPVLAGAVLLAGAS